MSESIPSQAQTEVNRWLQQGIAAVKAGERQQARDLLLRVVEQDEENALAWLWLSSVMDSLKDQETCLTHVLSLDPHNQAATRGLEAVRKKLQAQAPAPDHQTTHEALAMVKRRQRAAQGAATPPVAPEPTSVAIIKEPAVDAALADDAFDLSNQYLCPYCAVPTQPQDRQCKSCGNNLWIQVPRLSEMSTVLWGTVGIQFLNSINYFVLLLWSLFDLVLQIRDLALAAGIGHTTGGEPGNPLQSLFSFQNPLGLIPLYLGMSHDVSPEIADMAFELLPRGVFILLILPLVFAVLTLVALSINAKPIYYLVVATSVFDVLFVLACFVIPLNTVVPMPFKGAALLLTGIKIYLVFQIKDDFSSNDERILLRQDHDVSDGTQFLERGLHYARQKKWALSALHLRKATQLIPDQVDGPINLMLAYIRLNRPALAAQVLGVFKQSNPDDPRIEKLDALIKEIKSGEISA